MKERFIVSKFLKQIWRAFEWLSEKRAPENHNWIVQWEISHQCNLRCDYCFIDHTNKEIDVNRARETVVKLNPKYLIITGGEPLIVPDIADIIRDIYSRCQQPHLVINTNLSINVEYLYDLLDILNTIHISMDGLGEINALHRHISGDIILDNIKKLHAEKQRRNSVTALLTLTVVTTDNYRHIPEMTKRIIGEIGDIYMSYGSVEPYWADTSILNDPDKMSWFLENMQPLMARFPERVILVGALSPKNFLKDKVIDKNLIKSHKGRSWVNCKRQYFRTSVIPNGDIIRCKPIGYVKYYKLKIREHLQQKQFLGAMTALGRMIYTTIINPYDEFCPFPCKCEEMLDDILNSVDIPEISLFAGHFVSEELKHISRFCQKHWNQPIQPYIQEKLLAKPDRSPQKHSNQRNNHPEE